MMVVAGHVDPILKAYGSVEHPPGGILQAEHRDGEFIVCFMSPRAIGSERATPAAKGLLGHLDTVELRVIRAKLVIERDLLLEHLVAVGQNLGDGASVLGPESLDPESSHVVENPDAKRLARHAHLGRVVDDRLAVLDGNDPGVRNVLLSALATNRLKRK